MNGLLFRRRFVASAVGISILAFAACTNEEYDLEELDTNVTLLKDVAIPLGDIAEGIKLNEILDLGENQTFITEDESGNLSFSYYPEDFYSVSFTVPELDLAGNTLSDGYVTYAFPEVSVAYVESLEIPDIELNMPETMEYEISIDNEDLPKEIKDIERVEFESVVQLELGFEATTGCPIGEIDLCKGATLVFPEWMEISEVTDLFTQSEDGHSFTLKEDMVLGIGENKETDVVMFDLAAIDFEKIPEGQGIMDGRLHIKAVATFDADLKIPGSRISASGKFAPVFFTSLSIGELSVTKVIADIDVDMDQNLADLSLEGLPEFLMNEENVLDFTDARVDLSFHNNTPLSGSFSIDIKTSSATEEIAKVRLATPQFAASDNDGQTYRWSFAEKESIVPEGYSYVNTAGLNGLLARIPERISFENFEFNETSEYIEIVPGAEYEGVISYGISTPLAFGENLKLSFDMDVENLGVKLEDMTVKSAELSLDITNTIPLGFTLAAQALDKDGNIIPGITLGLADSALAAGSLDSPQTTSLSLELKNEADELAFDGIRLTLKAVGSSVYAGTSLNMNQGLEIRNMVLALPDGISTEL